MNLRKSLTYRAKKNGIVVNQAILLKAKATSSSPTARGKSNGLKPKSSRRSVRIGDSTALDGA